MTKQETHIGGLERAESERKARIDELMEVSARRKAQVDELARAVIQRDLNIDKLRQTVTQREIEIRVLEQSVSERGVRIEALEKSAARRATDTRELEQSISQRETRIEELEQSAALQESRIGDLEHLVAERDVRVDELEQKVSKRDQQLVGVQAVLDAERTRKNQIAETKNQLSIRLNALQTSNAGQLAGALYAIESKWPKLVGRILAPAKFTWSLISLRLPQQRRMRRRVKKLRSSRLFDLQWYVQNNPDVILTGQNPVIHWLDKGWKEGRDPHPLFNTDWYLNQNSDVAFAGVNPLFHFVDFGAAEGRDPHPLFDCSWYLSENPDVAEAGVNPLVHYLEYGAGEGRDPLPEFDSDWYLEQNPDVAAAEINPLMHYVTRGAADGRDPNPHFNSRWFLTQHPQIAETGTNPLEHYLANSDVKARVEYSTAQSKRRCIKTFDTDLDEATRTALRNKYAANISAPDRLVSIVTPTYNRTGLIGKAIQSVLEQTHANWELIVVDDGSNDDTQSIVNAYTHDRRVKFIKQDRGGVCRARNTALDLAQGELIAFLDSDNVWDREYLALMVAGFEGSSLDLAYSGLRLIQDGEVVGYRGDTFDYADCLELNYVDINIVMARRTIIGAIRFDESIRRMNDWDFLLNISAKRKVEYFPFVGATYSFNERADQISQREPQIYRKLIQKRHRERRKDGSLMNTRNAFAKTRLDFALLIAAHRGKRDEWGDYHFATGIAQALERRGHNARLFYYQEEIVGAAPDVAISLRGLTEHPMPSGSIKVVWSISHPDLLTWEQIDDCDLLFCASLTWPQAIRWAGKSHAYPLLQCTDRARFYLQPDLRDYDDRVLFVGNSRKAERAMVTQAAAVGLNLHVYGKNWEGRIPGPMINGEHIPNERLSSDYATAGVVLNDHWPSMKDFGYISNRVFDVVASGGNLVSDHVPGIQRVFGDSVTTVRDAAEISRLAEVEKSSANTQDKFTLGTWVHEYHSFDNRIDEILSRIEEFALMTQSKAAENILASIRPVKKQDPNKAEQAPAYLGKVNKLRVGIVPQLSGHVMTSSAYVRLVQPMTTELDGWVVELVRLDNQTNGLRDLDVVIVSRTAFDNRDQAERFTDKACARRLPLVVDVDDAFHLMDETHPEFEAYQPKLEALDLILSKAKEIWCSTKPLQQSLEERFSQTRLITNSLDPRLWQTYRQSHDGAKREGSGKLELLYAGAATQGNDLAMVMPVLEELAAEQSINLTIVGIAPEIPIRPWIRRLSSGADSIYPRFAPWLRRRSFLFDVGIAPLTNTPFNRYKSDLKILEYLAMGLVPIASACQPYLDSQAIDNDMLCSDAGDWMKRLRSLENDAEYLLREKARVTDLNQYVWRDRSASATGRQIAERLFGLVAH